MNPHGPRVLLIWTWPGAASQWGQKKHQDLLRAAAQQLVEQGSQILETKGHCWGSYPQRLPEEAKLVKMALGVEKLLPQGGPQPSAYLGAHSESYPDHPWGPLYKLLPHQQDPSQPGGP